MTEQPITRNGKEVPRRRCYICQNKYPATPEFFFRDNRHQGPLAFSRRCKRCEQGRRALNKRLARARAAGAQSAKEQK